MTPHDAPSPDPIHASCVAIDGAGILLLGASGAGKSDLALRLIDRGAMLVSDDYTQLLVRQGTLVASAPPTIAGRIEVRELGIVDLPHVDEVAVALAIRLDDIPGRMPDRSTRWIHQEIALPLLAIDPFAASTPIKVELALRECRGGWALP